MKIKAGTVTLALMTITFVIATCCGCEQTPRAADYHANDITLVSGGPVFDVYRDEVRHVTCYRTWRSYGLAVSCLRDEANGGAAEIVPDGGLQ